ncbi:sodium-coupled monocarboxylate transporter 1-like isoform X2 [Tribolium castaneum]|uniref:sodium-coupled monocarboxylate transporter 1-like isoform X2 n=1 Tax=Tribolium castaneum TaxID=7070 RepID=UPI0030FE12AC
MVAKTTFTFSFLDYIILIIVITISAILGIYHGTGKRQNTANDIMRSKKNNVIVIALSVTVCHFSALTFLGVPADVYRFAYIYLPVFFNLEIVSIYEYLERRFDRKTKLLSSFLFVLAEALYSPLVIYTPSLAFSAATGINVHIITSVMCGICVCYTAIGGLKAVIWTDFLQFIVIVATMLFIIFIGLQTQGGFLSVWNTAIVGQRLDIFDFDLDPTKRNSFWTLVIGSTFQWINYISLTQTGMQKFLCLPTFKACVWSLIYCALSMSVVVTVAILTGLSIYDRYVKCDPLISKTIEKHDQIVPYYILDVTGNMNGISGVFMGTIFCAALSSLSSGFNATSNVIYKDFLTLFLKRNISKRKVTNILQLIVVVAGLFAVMMGFLVEHLGELVPLTISVTGMVSGPSMGIYTLGMMFPKANSNGAFYGALGGILGSAAFLVPKEYYQYHNLISYPHKPLSTENCNSNLTFFSSLDNKTVSENSFQPPFIFRISYDHHCFIGVIITVILGLIISYLTNKNDAPVDKKLISPICHFLLPKHRDREVMEHFMENKDQQNS